MQTQQAPGAASPQQSAAGSTPAAPAAAAGSAPQANGTPSAAAPAGANPASFPSASLYVGDLNPDVNEGVLFELFNAVGPVATIRVCRDAITRRSLGYAYVNFHNVVDAERALDTMNFTPIKGRPCRIMWCHRDPSVRKSGIGNIFIKNLAPSIDNKQLFDTFSNFGNILSCKVVTDDVGNSRGYGFVHYETQEAAELAIEKVNDMMIEGMQVKVEPFIPKKDRHGQEGGARFTNIFVKNLHEDVDEEMLKKEFEAHGTLSSVVVMRNQEDGKSKGFGFVNFEEPDAAKSAVEALNGKELCGQGIFVARAQKKREREAELRKKWDSIRQERMSKYQGANLYVKNLDDSVDDEQLRAEFDPFGSITSAKVMRDESGNSRGFGFVCFTTTDEATKAVTEMNGKLIGQKPLYVAIAQQKEVRRAQLEAQHAQRQNGMRMQQPGPPMGQPGMYPGAPMFYAQPPNGMPPQGQRPGFVYGQPPMMPRGQWRPQGGPPGGVQGRPGYQPMPNYVMPVQGRPVPQNAQAGKPRGRPMGGQPGVPAGMPQQQNGGNRRQFKYTPNARNRDMPQPGQDGSGPLTSTALAQAPPEQQKTMLGERLFPLIHNEQPNLAGKITGMLLEMDNSELLVLLENQDALRSKIQEALSVLQAHSGEGAGNGEATAEAEA